jgi:O-antigen/teichoic acid export membrane protein
MSNDSPPDPSTPPTSIRGQVVRGSIWTILGYGTSLAVRLASTLILSRLLFPNAFGLMTMVSTVTVGLLMLSDVGIDNAIIQSKRGDDTDFLNTAWTLKVGRGILLWLICIAISGPMATFYHEPALRNLLIVTGFTSVMHGLESTSLMSMSRNLDIKKLTLLDLIAQLLSTVTNIVLALIYPSVWVLVIGALIGSTLRLIASHTKLKSIHNALQYTRDCATEILHFGRWIFLSSSLHFFSRQADRLIIGEALGMSQLGVYSIAVLISEATAELANQLSHRVLYPALNHVMRTRPQDLNAAYYRARLRIDAALLPAIGFMTATSFAIINLLYDPRYVEAGWMLQFLSLRAATYALVAPCESYVFALGQLRYGAIRSAARMVWILSAVPVAWYFGGLVWLIAAIAASEIPVLLMLWQACGKFGRLRPEREALALLFFGVGFCAGRLALTFLPWLSR